MIHQSQFLPLFLHHKQRIKTMHQVRCGKINKKQRELEERHEAEVISL
jgi:hypothetical protein